MNSLSVFVAHIRNLSRLVGIYPVADCNNSIKVVEFHITANLPLPFLLNCFQNGKSCFLLQLTGLIDICQMLTDGGYLNAKELGYCLLK